MLRTTPLPTSTSPAQPALADVHSKAVSPHSKAGTPHSKAVSPHSKAVSPHSKAVSPNGKAVSPNGKAEHALGKWRCSACTMWNSQVNMNCATCMTKRPGHKINLKEEQKEMKQVSVVNPSFSVRFRALFSKSPPQWTCPACTFANRGIFTQCQSCWYFRTEADGPTGHHASEGKVEKPKKEKVSSEDPSSDAASVFDSIRALFRRPSNATHTKSATTSEAVKRELEEEEKTDGGRKEEKEKWKCQQCTLLNPDSLEKCSACELPKNFEIQGCRDDQSSPVDPSSSSLTRNRELESDAATPTTDRGPLQLDPELCLKDMPTPLPLIPTHLPSPQDLRHRSLLSSHGAPTWCCKICGAFNVVNHGLRQCFICGIGTIPDCYLPHSPARETGRVTSTPQHQLQPQSGKQESPSPYHPQPQPQPLPQQLLQVQNLQQSRFQDSVNQDYVNLPLLGLGGNQATQYPNPSNQGSSPAHLPTRVDHLHASSSSLSPLHITSSDGRVVPQSEPSYANLHTLHPSPSPRHSIGSNYRDIPLWEQENLLHLRLQYAPFSAGGHFQPESSVEESYIDPYVRPTTPTDYLRAQSSLGQPGAESKLPEGQEEKAEDSPRVLLEASGSRCNRTKCVQERREEDVLRASAIYQAIERYSRMSEEPFTDPDFPPADKSLYVQPSQPVARWQVGKWERPAGTRDDFDSEGIEWTVLREPRPGDIAQGVLGNCWVLSALGVVAEQPQLIEDILITKQYCPEVGAYQVRLCRDGKWEVVVVDDCFPCLDTGELVFSKAHRKQLWVPLIEKALAKLYGSYEALNAGRVLLGLSVLTGLPCEKIHLKRPSAKGEEIDTDLIWARLLSFRERGFPMSASCGGEGGEEEERTYAMLGLESNHAYSILDVRQIGTDQLIRLRNPWGKYSWKGSWSDQDARWDSQPWMRDELRAVGGEAGVFWMDAREFFQYFCEVDVCKYRPNWHSLRSEGKLLPFAAPQMETLAFEVRTTTEVDISIYQPSSRGRARCHNLVDMAVLILRYSASPSLLPVACSLESGSHIQSIVTTNGFLCPGRYLILPLAFNHYRHYTGKSGSLPERSAGKEEVEEGREVGGRGSREEGAVPYVLAMFSAQELVYESVSTRPGFLPESLMLLAEKSGKVTQSFPNMLLYEVYMKHSCRYVVAVNLDRRLHFTVACDGTESVNVTCSRGALHTEDCIPPRHRQILWVLTQLEGTARYSVLMKISSTCTELNSRRNWGAQHLPPLSPTTSELHTPRFIIG